MKKFKFIIEKTATGFSAYAEDDKYPVFTTGASIAELKRNILEALNLLLEHTNEPAVTGESVLIKLDLP